MALKNAKYFDSSPDWHTFSNDPSRRDELALKSGVQPTEPIDAQKLRPMIAASESAWAAEHPLDRYGYFAHEEHVPSRNGGSIKVKVYRPLKPKSNVLPMLFITHGGGFFQGSYTTAEIAFLRPIWRNFDFVMISVDYRFAPEHPFPVPLEDSWDALQWATNNNPRLGCDASQVFLAGSSAGANLAAGLSIMAREAKLPIAGVCLIIPVLCHPDHTPSDRYEFSSYEQCEGTLLSSSEMREVWKLYLKDQGEGSDPLASPLLADLRGLPPHLLYVAGQDPCRDEGIAYSQKLTEKGVRNRLWIIQVCHTNSAILTNLRPLRGSMET